MRRLAISLLLLVGLATLAAGWTLDRLYSDAVAAGEPLDEWRRLGRALADGLEGADPSRLPPQASLINRAALPLDQDPSGTLRRALDGPTGLALESDTGVTVHYAMGEAQVLALQYRPSATAPVAPRLLATLGFYLALLILVLLGLLPLFRRLRRLVRATERFGEGDLATRVPTAPRSELHALERGFNGMAERIERLVEDNRLLGQGVAHDLRTPLARLRFGIDVLAERLAAEPAGTRRSDRTVERLQMDLDAMESQLETLLGYARLESRDQADKREPLELDALVQDVLERASAFPPGSANGRVDWQRPSEPVTVMGHEGQLRMLIANLLQNAERYGGGTLRVRLEPSAGEVVLGFEDDGPGISLADADRLRRPFERAAADPAGARGYGTGHGLGLALIERIATRHGGSLRIGASGSLGGARVEVTLPSRASA